MADHAQTFLLVTILMLVTILLVFGMRTFASARLARAQGADRGAYRDLAERAATAESATAAALAALQADVGAVKGRLAAIEKVLREVE
jgi:hypothetical protein